jgi:hypothetical protein
MRPLTADTDNVNDWDRIDQEHVPCILSYEEEEDLRMLLPDDALYKAYLLLYNDKVEHRLHEAREDVFSASPILVLDVFKATTLEAQKLREDCNILSNQLESERTKLAQLKRAHANVEADLV